MSIRTLLVRVVAICVVLDPAIAHADAAACSDAYTSAQTLRRDGKLIDARAALRQCTQPSCPGFIVKDCVTWLGQVETALPSVVPVATDAAGNDVLDARVLLDGKVVKEKPDGQPIDVDPGPHTVTFERVGGAMAEKTALFSEGDRSKRVSVVFAKLGVVAPAADTAPEPAVSREHGRGSWKVVGLVAAGVGLVGVGVGTFFGVQAIGDKSDAHCPNNVCSLGSSPSSLRSAESAATLSTAFIATGAALMAVGLVTWLVARRSDGEPGVKVTASPVATAKGGGLALILDW